ncbi:MAG TPA: PVC-type heme-binding CxxCH protein [Tepidisphaeraceae bacterium]|jgi:putative membrane-bound dehydrogenase-like protein|nr:PVC-type heme-binding CxxCH protein [Tepidisphaeraceae bacterium]
MRTVPLSLIALLAFWASAFAAADAPLPPSEAASHMTLPPGFSATLFAGEPDVVQPICMTFDDRGRLWVAECLTYPNWQQNPADEGQDRILIFEDDGTGRFAKRTVFLDHIHNLTSIEIGFGGVWMISLPNLVFIPMADDKPSGSPRVLLDGFDSLHARHNVANQLKWGPDGWLWGCHGIMATSSVAKPGTPDDQRTKINCGVWRFHPTKNTFEVVASGTTNPWGLDFDDYGEAFITNCVIKHLFHVIPGAHYHRMGGHDLDPYAYTLMESCADHIHWAGGDWTTSRGGAQHSEAGGGHAHVGAMVYLGDNWPDSYRNSIFMCNLHGNRINNDLLERKGSGYVAHHGRDFLMANDTWFRGISILCGPDGGVYVSDWTDTGECHNYNAIDRTNGRIYKVTYGKPAPFNPNLAARSDAELVELQLHKNDWWVRHARRLLQERALSGQLSDTTRPALLHILQENHDVTRQLRALWALHATGGINDKLTLELLVNPQESIRAWAIRLAVDDHAVSAPLLKQFERLANDDPSPVVRLALASALQRLRIGDRWTIAERLMAHAQDAADPNLPLMIWYGIEALAPADPQRGAELALKAKIPLLREYLARQIAGAAE